MCDHTSTALAMTSASLDFSRREDSGAEGKGEQGIAGEGF